MVSEKGLEEFGRMCHDSMVESQYTGGISLSQPELIEWASRHSQIQLRLREPERSAVLTVLAVNCAYHYYDQEGFWPHFCALLGVTHSTTELLGARIEAYLRNTRRLSKVRVGPFRYVGAILEQCGVSRMHIGSFARIMFDLAGGMGWGPVAALELPEFQRLISRYECSRYLMSYLGDVEGWRFSIHLARLMELYEHGLMRTEVLVSQPGFQPSFWALFLREGEDRGERPPGASTTSRPRLLFDPRTRSVVIRVPSRAHLNGAPPDWSFPLTRLTREHQWQTSYAGVVQSVGGRMQEWRTPGWLPDGRPVLFDAISGLIPQGDAVSAGSYFLLLPSDDSPDCTGHHEIGPVSLPSPFEPHRAWAVTLTGSDVVAGYSIAGAGAKVVELGWQDDAGRFAWSGPGTEVFVGCLPSIKVSPDEALELGVAAVYAQLDNEFFRFDEVRLQRLVRRRAKEGRATTGRIWLAPLARSSAYSVSRSAYMLEFVVVPDMAFDFEPRLYGAAEIAELSVDAVSGYGVYIENHLPEHRGERLVWGFGSDVDEFSGQFQIEEVVVDFAAQIRRALLCDPTGRQVWLTEATDLEDDGCLWLWALPASECGVSLRWGARSADRLVTDQEGRALVRTSVLSDLLRDLPDTGFDEVCVTDYGSGITVGLGACVFDSEAFKAAAIEGVDFSSAPQSTLTKVAQLVTEVVARPQSVIRLDRIPSVHPALDGWLRSILACAIFYDGAVVYVDGHLIGLEDLGLSESEFSRLASGGHEPGRSDGSTGHAMSAVARWMRPSSATPPDESKTYRRWVEVLARRPFTGLDSTWPAEWHTLTYAWTNYTEGRPELGLARLDGFEPADELVRALSSVFRFHAYLRLARFSRAHLELEGACRAASTAAWAEAVGSLFCSGKGLRLSEQQVPPLSSDDRRFLALLSEVARPNFDLDAEQDWLVLWAGYRLSAGDRKVRYGRRLIEIIEAVPASPEVRDLEGELDTMGGSWCE